MPPLLHESTARAIADGRVQEAARRRKGPGRDLEPGRAPAGPPTSPAGSRRERAVALGTAVLAATQLLAAGWMLVSPRSFFAAVGPFGAYNDHYVRDVAAFTGGLGVGLLLSLRWPAMRAGTLATVAATTGLHAVNHWADISSAHPGSSAGVLDAVSLTVGLGFAAALTVMAASRRRV